MTHLQADSIRQHVHVHRNLALQQRAACRPCARELRGVGRVPLQCALRKAPQQQECILKDRVQRNGLLHLPTYRAAVLRPGVWAEGIGLKPAGRLRTLESKQRWWLRNFGASRVQGDSHLHLTMLTHLICGHPDYKVKGPSVKPWTCMSHVLPLYAELLRIFNFT